MIDGRVISERTPVTRAIAVGEHDLALRQDGAIVWTHKLVAEADADHEFRPVFTEQKKRERRQRGTERTVAAQNPSGDIVVEPPPDASPAPPTPPETPPIAVAPPVDLPPPPPTPAPRVVPRETASKERAVAVPQYGPVMVAPNAVKRVAGETPTLGASKPQNMPSVVAAKVCIDAAGVVTAVEILTKLERHTTMDLSSTMRGWRYAPYKQDGAAIPACFSVNFRVK